MRRVSCCLVALLLCGVTGAQSPVPRPRASAQSAAMRGIRQTTPLPVHLWFHERKHDNFLLTGESKDKIACAEPSRPETVKEIIEKSAVRKAVFQITLDQIAAGEAEVKQEWETVYRLLNAALAPTLPYLDLPGNNAVDLVWKLGGIMQTIAEQTQKLSGEEEIQKRAARQFAAARQLYLQLAKADWTPLGELAQVVATKCQFRSGAFKEAGTELEKIREPMPGEGTYGHYWLVKGWLEEQAGSVETALNAAVLSLVFENKDVDTFPDALLLTARCYEKLEDWSRARDVNFEVASLFTGTPWADKALASLKRILDAGHSGESEAVSVESAFFGFREDMQELAQELLKKQAHKLQPESHETAPVTP